jgi:hypothetical protein
MDPYLERPARWQGFHATLLVDIQRAIVGRVPPTYVL